MNPKHAKPDRAESPSLLDHSTKSVPLSEVDRLGVAPVELAIDAQGHRRQALVVRDTLGVPRAYLNRCKHIPVPLDGFQGDALHEDKRHLICFTHGALYRLHDGMCVAGPCVDEALESIPFVIRAGVVLIQDSAPYHRDDEP
ncbi:MAG: Rieske 2Fe-2S domain-containing protein [Myxococcota bacterium]